MGKTGSMFVRLSGCALLLLSATVLSGCGGGGEAPEGKLQGAEDESAGNGDETAAPGKVAAKAEDKPNGQWFAGIPNDVWYPEPLAIAADGRPVGGAPPGNGGGTMIEPPQAVAGDPEPMAGGAGGELDWGKIVPAEVVDAEVTDIRNRLKQNLVSVAQYNQSYLSMMPHIQTMAAMAAIAAEHPGDIRWKENALVIRDLAAKMGSQKLMSGPKAKREVEEPFLGIEDTFAGSPPAGLEAPDAEALFSDVAEMAELMKRLDVAFEKRIAIDIGTADSLKEKADLAKHEGGMIAALGQVIMLEGYGYSDDDEFKGHAQPMVEAGIQMIEAAETGNFAAFDAAKTRIRQSCTECHRTYR